MNTILADAVLDMVAWFELVDDDTLDPDLAVKALEQLAYHLHKLEGADRAAFVEHARARVRSERPALPADVRSRHRRSAHGLTLGLPPG